MKCSCSLKPKKGITLKSNFQKIELLHQSDWHELMNTFQACTSGKWLLMKHIWQKNELDLHCFIARNRMEVWRCFSIPNWSKFMRSSIGLSIFSFEHLLIHPSPSGTSQRESFVREKALGRPKRGFEGLRWGKEVWIVKRGPKRVYFQQYSKKFKLFYSRHWNS